MFCITHVGLFHFTLCSISLYTSLKNATLNREVLVEKSGMFLINVNSSVFWFTKHLYFRYHVA
jgi:hypothetical protein